MMTASFRRLWICLQVVAALVTSTVALRAESVFVGGPTQFIAALGHIGAMSGDNAQTWGFWEVDPGPRGVRVSNYGDLINSGGVAPDGWTFDDTAWWLEEHGLIMEAPVFPLPAGQYVVTGGREVTSVLTVGEPDVNGQQAWSLADGATLFDVTHLGCRAAVYSVAGDGQACTPDNTPMDSFPLTPASAMPAVAGCNKLDYQVLIVVGMMVDG
jgi:hypothetical protein